MEPKPDMDADVHKLAIRALGLLINVGCAAIAGGLLVGVVFVLHAIITGGHTR